METIRMNELARELEVKSKAVLDYLAEIGVTDKKSHSSALDGEIVEKVRAHFRQAAEQDTQEKPKPAVAPPAPARAPAEAKKPEVQPIRRSLEDIKAEARRALTPPARPPAPVR